jgi:hypothetical protein
MKELKEKIRKFLFERTESKTVTKIFLIDFDGTISNTPEKEEGIKIYKEKTGNDYPHKGWWGRNESLDMNMFDIKPIQSTVDVVKKHYGQPNTKVFLLTGRVPKNSQAVEKILDSYGVKFDDYFYKTSHDTLDFKLKKMSELLVQYPDTQEVTLFEDRKEHFDAFEKWGENNKNIKFKLIKVV